MERYFRRVAVFVAAGLLVAGCTGSAPRGATSGGVVAEKAVLVAAAKTAEAGSSKVAMVAEVASGATSFTMSGDGVFDYSTQAGSMTFRLTGDEIPDAFSGYEMRFLKGVIYMKFPPQFSQYLAGLKPWIKMDVAQLSKQTALAVPGLGSFPNQDPTSALGFLQGATNVKVAGTETVRGEKTTHYTMTIDLAKAIAALPAEAKDGVEDLVKAAQLKTIPMETWIDGEGRARRVRFALDLSKVTGKDASSLGQGKVAVGMDLYEFGAPVQVAAPPPDQVSDYEALAELGRG